MAIKYNLPRPSPRPWHVKFLNNFSPYLPFPFSVPPHQNHVPPKYQIQPPQTPPPTMAAVVSALESPSASPPLDPVALDEELAPLPKLKTRGDTDITFDGQLSLPLKLHEDVRTGCGGQTWPAGMVLGKHLLRYHRDELGSARM